MANRNKADKDKEWEKAEVHLTMELQEKRMLDGMKEICSSMKDDLKEFWHKELDEIKKKR